MRYGSLSRFDSLQTSNEPRPPLEIGVYRNYKPIKPGAGVAHFKRTLPGSNISLTYDLADVEVLPNGPGYHATLKYQVVESSNGNVVGRSNRTIDVVVNGSGVRKAQRKIESRLKRAVHESNIPNVSSRIKRPATKGSRYRSGMRGHPSTRR